MYEIDKVKRGAHDLLVKVALFLHDLLDQLALFLAVAAKILALILKSLLVTHSRVELILRLGFLVVVTQRSGEYINHIRIGDMNSRQR